MKLNVHVEIDHLCGAQRLIATVDKYRVGAIIVLVAVFAGLLTVLYVAR